MQNPTSYETYKQIEKDGTLCHTQLLVYEALLKSGIATDRQIQKMTGLDINCVTGRRDDLYKMKIVKKSGNVKIMNKTGKEYPHTLWKINDDLTALDIHNRAEKWRSAQRKVTQREAVKDFTLNRWCIA